MSLIVARIEESSIYIVSDTKLTYPQEAYPKLLMAPPKLGVIKSVIVNQHLCVSFACDDIEFAESAIKECRRIYDNVNKILHYLLKVNIDTDNGIEFIACVSFMGMNKIYEIRNQKLMDVKYSWIGSKVGYNIFQEKMFEQRSNRDDSEVVRTDLSNAMEDVIRSGKDETVNGFRIAVSNSGGFFEYQSHITVAFPPRSYHFSETGTYSIPIVHGTAEEGGYNVHVFSSHNRYDVLAIHLLQGNFGIFYIQNKALLRPEIIKNVDEIEFAEMTREKYGIGPLGFTYSIQRSYLERGNKAFSENDFIKAIKFYDLGLKEKEQSYRASLNFNKGISLFTLKKFNVAVLFFSEAIKLDKSFETQVKKILFRTR